MFFCRFGQIKAGVRWTAGQVCVHVLTLQSLYCTVLYCTVLYCTLQSLLAVLQLRAHRGEGRRLGQLLELLLESHRVEEGGHLGHGALGPATPALLELVALYLKESEG